jgi:2-dehydro-3-deoxyphosphooctonate aldolase (KDO 8-P synthase)
MGPEFTLIAGPCVIESESLCLRVAAHLAELREQLKIQVVFKASFDKANRTSGSSFRGPGLDQGLRVLERVRQASGLPVLTDVHEGHQAEPVAEVVDVLQVPAFLCRQTDLVQSCGSAAKKHARTVNVKKGQFLAASDMAAVRDKLVQAGAASIWFTERGTSFGYHDLVVDFRNLPRLRELGCPVILDATHAVQQPGALGGSSGGQPDFIEPLAAAGAAVGINGLFLEVHPEPKRGLSDATTMLHLERLRPLIQRVLRIREVINAA